MIKLQFFDDRNRMTRAVMVDITKYTFEPTQYLPDEAYCKAVGYDIIEQNPTYEAKAKTSINTVAVSQKVYAYLMDKFDDSYYMKLSKYTGEELFYTWRLATYQTKDVFWLSLKAKLFRYLRDEDEKYGIHPTAWIKLRSRFQREFEEFLESEDVDTFVASLEADDEAA
jgi:hypothetical protein